MAIEKFNPSVYGEIIPYVQANTYVVQNITNAEALAVWVYLLTLPKDWLVIKAHVKKHFKFGDDKIKKIFAYLNKHALIEYVQGRGENGRLEKMNEIRVLNGSRFIPEQSTAGSKTTPPVNHTSGKHPTTKNIDKQIIQKSQKRDRLSKSYCPGTSELILSKEAEKIARDKKLDIDRCYHRFQDYHKAEGTLRVDWKAAFIKWLLDERVLPHPKNETKSTVQWFGENH